MEYGNDDQNECLLEPEHVPTGKRKYQCKTNSVKLTRKLTFKTGIVITFAVIICINVFYQRMVSNELYTELADENEWLQFKELNISRNLNGVPNGYLVFSSGCQIPDYNPFSKQVLQYFTKQNYAECLPNKKPITRLVHNQHNQSVYLIIDETAKTEMYGNEPIFCCYSKITRGGINETADMKFNTSDCNTFAQSFQLPPHIEYLLIKCRTERKSVPLYVNIHFVIRKRAEIKERIHRLAKNESKKPLSVLLIGIDSISRLNLIRSMPQTRKYLVNNHWFELMGYNKIGDNTFPNLMAILTGYNRSTAFAKCDPDVFAQLDKCPLVWKDFHDNGYTTAYAEDEAGITTFNYFKYGFLKQPTDYYLRPILLAAEYILPIKKKSGLSFCLGYKHYADYIFDYGVDFARTFRKQPHFGLFWANTFSHEDLSDPSAMDLKMHNYLLELNKTGILDETMVIFFSDHGMRFGPIRQTEIGWLEERLPFMFVSLPKWFRRKNPEFVQSLNVNQNRLTNPFDIHMTLKHIIKMSNPEYAAVNINYTADGCKQCQSIFYDIPINRSCSDAGIETHWCTCIKFKTIDLLSSFIQDGVKYIIDYMNTVILVDFLDKSTANETGLLETGKSCAKLQLKEIKSARKGTMEHFHVIENYLVTFETTPGNGVFEATLSYIKSEKKFKITGSISRLNKYGDQSSCVINVKAKKYCYCIDNDV